MNIKQLFESSLRNYKLQTIVWIETEKLWTIQTIVWIKPEKVWITNNCLNWTWETINYKQLFGLLRNYEKQTIV